MREAEHRINNFITAPEVRLVGENVEPGIYPLSKAKTLAEEQGIDLVEISSTTTPPVCRIVDYKKFLYEQKKKKKEVKANAVKSVVKEIRFGPNTDEHDVDFKLKHAIKFLQEGAKVRAYVFYRGRTIVYKERGEVLLLQFAEKLADYGKVEMMPRLEGKKMIMMIAPKTKSK
ncbi:MAG TPA: translation initiation factor IF-3 [Bacteroidia bacterium]|nr:translation initiation factor IF-3 [Bacteroidia bacterium]